jgi:hypothetical protein
LSLSVAADMTLMLPSLPLLLPCHSQWRQIARNGFLSMRAPAAVWLLLGAGSLWWEAMQATSSCMQQ